MNSKQSAYTCPVCFYDRLREPPKSHMICPCCDTQFGYDDHVTTHEELRAAWIERGANWYSVRVSPPIGWSAEAQLAQGLNSSR